MLDANKILQVDALDLIFEGRNKDYGAYELRTNYRKRLMVAVLTMLLLCACLIILNAFTGRPRKVAPMYVKNEIQLEDVTKEKPVEPPPVEPPKPQPQVRTEIFVTPIITKEEVKPDEMPPAMEDLEDVKISTIKQDGDNDIGIVAPPIKTEGTGVIVEPKKQESDLDQIVLDVQIQSEYPGGMSAWVRYLTKTLPKYYTEDFVERNIKGRVVVQFIVDREGNVSEVHGIEGPKELWAIAENVIRKSGKWTPAVQNGRQVKSYKTQPIIFEIEDGQ